VKFCQDHWDRLRRAIDQRGLSPLIHQGGEAIAEAQMRELQGIDTAGDFDPLMSAHWAIAGNASQAMERGGANPLYLLTSGPEDPVDPALLKRAASRGIVIEGPVTWPRCPLCYVNLAHRLTCFDPKCEGDRVAAFD
jgi:hypothetical protein